MRRLAGCGVVLAAACVGSRMPPRPDALGQRLQAAQAVYFRGEFDSAHGLYDGILAQARAERDSVTEARALTWLGLVAWKQGRYPDARGLGETALALKLRLHLAADLYRSYNALGLLAWNEGRLDDALGLFDSAGHSAAAVGDARGVGVAAGNAGLVQVELGDFAAGRRGIEAQRDTGRSIGDARVEGNALTNLGMLAIRVGDPAAAIPVLEQARRRYLTIQYFDGDQNALGQLGTAYQALGEPSLAIAALDSALAEARAEGLRQEEASDLEALAELHRDAGDHPHALDLYAQAQTIDHELGLSVELGADQRAEAEIHVALGDDDLADRYAGSALQTHSDAGARFEMLEDHLLLADIADRTGRRAAAGRELRQAATLAQRLGTRTARLHVALAEARIADRAQDGPGALRMLADAWKDVAGGGFTDEWEAYALQARALGRVGRLRDAERAGRSALAAVERVRGNYGSGLLRTSYAAERWRVYADLVTVLLRQRRVRDAFAISDLARGRALFDQRFAAPLPESSAEEEALLERVNQLAFKADSAERELAGDPDNPSLGATARSFRMRLERTRGEYEAAFVHARERRAAGRADRSERSVVTDLPHLQADEVILEYLVTADQVIGFVVSPDTIVGFTTALRAVNLESRVRLARALIARHADDPAELAPVLGALYDALIAPAVRTGALRRATRLLVVPHGVLAYLPFAALRGDSGYLIERYSLSYLPTAAALTVLRDSARSEPVSTPATAIAFAPEPARLPATAAEVVAFAHAVPGARAIVGAGATEARLRVALGDARIVHVAAHGVLNRVNPLFSRLELSPGTARGSADDGRLEVHEMIGAHIRPELVFLSGCETGLGVAGSTAYAPGEDFTTLSQSFLQAGARNVVATLWAVEDDGAAVFSGIFYHELRGTPPAEALALAQREMMSRPRYRAPFYWGSYEVAGGGGLPLPEQPTGPVSVTPTHSH